MFKMFFGMALVVLLFWILRRAWGFWSSQRTEDNAKARLEKAQARERALDLEEKIDVIEANIEERIHTTETEK